MSDFLFPRHVMFSRAEDVAGKPGITGSGYGGLGDGGAISQSYIALTTWMPASIQMKGSGGKPELALPQGPEDRPFYTLEIPPGYLNDGDVIFRDKAVDDLGREFLVIAIQATVMGWDATVQQINV